MLALIAAVLVLPFSLLVMKFKPADPRDAYGADEVEDTPASSGAETRQRLGGSRRAFAGVRVRVPGCGIPVARERVLQLMPTYAAPSGSPPSQRSFLPSP
ncbi:MAG: hypothetical protein ACLSVD_18030 [Eggerthellaceae bacterium]